MTAVFKKLSNSGIFIITFFLIFLLCSCDTNNKVAFADSSNKTVALQSVSATEISPLTASKPNEKIVSQTDMGKPLGVSNGNDVSLEEMYLYPFVNTDNKMGYINSAGKIIIEPVFSTAERFSDDCALVSIGDKNYFYINQNGEKIFNKAFSYAYPFSCGRAVAYYDNEVRKIREMLIIDMEGNIIQKFDDVIEAYKYQEDMLPARFSNTKYGYIDLDGNIIINPIYDYALPFSESVAAVAIFGEEYGMIDYIDKNGDIVLPASYKFDPLKTDISFSNSAACVQDDQTGMYGYINIKGDIIIPFQFTSASRFSETYASVCDEAYVSRIIDINGKYVGENTFEAIGDFSEGLAAVYSIGEYDINKVGFVDANGNIKIDIKYEDVYSASPYITPDYKKINGLIEVIYKDEKGSWRGYINDDDEIIFKVKWEGMK